VSRLRAARYRDLPAIEALLAANGLPTLGVADHLRGFVVVEEDGRVVGAAGAEVYGRHALLRSVVVDPAHRGRGIAGRMVGRVLERLAAGGAEDVYLLTTTAADYFHRRGFRPVGRAALPAALRASRELHDGVCDTAQAMALTLAGATRGGMR
jgi:amino-acid N-acetyltransferase